MYAVLCEIFYLSMRYMMIFNNLNIAYIRRTLIRFLYHIIYLYIILKCNNLKLLAIPLLVNEQISNSIFSFFGLGIDTCVTC